MALLRALTVAAKYLCHLSLVLPTPCCWTVEKEPLDSSAATTESKLTECCVTSLLCLCPTCTRIIIRCVQCVGRGRGSVQLCSEPWDSAVAPADECGLPCSAFLSAFIPQALLNLSVVLIPSPFLFVLTLGLLSCGSSVATDSPDTSDCPCCVLCSLCRGW